MTRGDLVPALQLDDVTHRFHSGGRVVVALDAVTAAAARGSVTGLIGPDGAGKTTLMRLAAGLLRPDSGRIAVFGIDVANEPLAAQSRLGYMPQHFGLYEDLTVRENLDLYADLQGVPPAERGARYAELLHMTGLGPFTARLAGRLSGGMKQKLGLACTLVRAPELLLLDEPTVGVDPVSRRELWEIVDHLTRAAGTTVVFSTAYLDEADRCGAVLLLHEGRLIAADDPRHLTGVMQGRSFRASVPGIGRRRLREALAAAPGVLDATIEGGHTRLVTEENARPPVALPGIGAIAAMPAAPRFEDAFVALLRKSAPSIRSPLMGQGRGGGEIGAERTTRPEDHALPTLPYRGGGLRRASSAAAGERADAIVVRHLSRRFGRFRAVDDISFNVKEGEIFGLLGANGAGKSTTFRMLCGLLPPSDGNLRVAGHDLRRAAAAARGRVGYMAQKFSLYGDLSVRENLRFFSSAYRLYGARQRQRIDWALAELELGPVADATSGELPLGFKQRLALACALMHEPDILFLDEPTSGVDPLARREFWQRIDALAEAGVTVLVTTHFMEEAEFCDRLAIMAQGRILAEGSSDALKARARHPNNPDPTMEDAFIELIESAQAAAGGP
jgi:drug efflux transport system ATP-binding protein